MKNLQITSYELQVTSYSINYPVSLRETPLQNLKGINCTGIKFYAPYLIPLTSHRFLPSAFCFLLFAFCFLPFFLCAQTIPPEIFGNYGGEAHITNSLLGIDENVPIEVDLLNTGEENDYILTIPDLVIGDIVLPVEMDYIIITPDGNGFKLTRANPVSFVIPELELPPLPPLLPDGGTFYNVPVDIILGNTKIEDYVLDLNMTVTATITILVPIQIPLNIHFVGLLFLPPEIKTVELPFGKVGTEYEASLEVIGIPPITWNISGGVLPAGLILDEDLGIISGIPTDSGIFVFTVMAINTLGVDDKELSIEIKAEDIIDTTRVSTANFMQIELYPNPTTGMLTINNEQLTMNNVAVFDIYGRKQKAECRMQNAERAIEIDLTELETGIYFIKIYTEKGVVTKKVIKRS